MHIHILVSRDFLLVARFCLLIAEYFLLVNFDRQFLLLSSCPLLFVCYVLLVTYACYILFVTFCPLIYSHYFFAGCLLLFLFHNFLARGFAFSKSSLLISEIDDQALSRKERVQKAQACQSLEILKSEILALENFLEITTTNGQYLFLE